MNITTFTTPDYQKFYSFYKKLPAINAITVAVMTFIWSIVDITVFSYSPYFYGIMMLGSGFLCLLIWWVIGAILATVTYYMSAIKTSQKIIATDAIIAIQKEQKKQNADKA